MGLLPLLLAVVIEWTFPLTDTCHEGLAFADGTTGVLVWGGGDEIRLTVGRGDLWDHRGGSSWTDEQSYSNIVSLVRQGRGDRLKGLFRVDEPANWGGRKNPTLLPLGRVVVKVPGRTLRHGSLDPRTGLGRLEFAEGDAVELAMARGGFSMRFPSAVTPAVAFRPSTETDVWTTLRNRGFEKAVVRADGFDWRLPEDPSVSVDLTMRGREAFLSTRRGVQPSAGFRSHEAVRADSVAKWTRFWETGARVNVPDPVLQRLYDYGMYRFGAMTDPDGVPAGLQGPWLEDDRTIAWSGDYHFNINVQECYSPAFRGGHFGNLLPLFRMVLSWRPLLRENARKFVRIDDGYVLPHSVDDRGVCIGGFWTGTIDHASAVWTAALMMRYVRYSGDVAFLREGGFDFMRGVMNVSRAMMEEREGRLSIPLAPSPEWGASDVRKAVGRDPSFQLAAAHRLARDLADAAALLGETPDPMWADVDRRLPPYTADADGISLFAGQPFTESHRHHSHLAGFYPFDTIDVDAARADGVLQKSYETWIRHGTVAWTGWCVPWASVLNVHLGNPVAAVRLLHDWDAFFCDPGHGSHHDAWTPGFSSWTRHPEIMQMDGQCGAATAVLELLAHEVDGKVGFFRGCPAEWTDVSFENLALSDGTRVDGRRLNGKVTVVKRPADSARFATALAVPGEAELKAELPEIFAKSAAHYKALDAAATPLMKDAKGELRTPHGFKRATGELDMRSIYWWTSGHFPGSLWYLYEAAGDAFFKDRATAWTEILAPISKYDENHDVGFMMYCSYGNARRILKTDRYDGILAETADSLSHRFEDSLGLLRSWGKIGDEKDFLVIPDNMMNLELLEAVSRFTGDPRFDRIARSHATVTMRHHFRADGGTYHVLNYDQRPGFLGAVQEIRRGQGRSCETAWSRGQSWAIYGYTMMYRFTKDPAYLAFAQKVSDFAINHPNMPADGVPYWDYGAPGEERDTSAASVMASGLLELADFVGGEKGASYRAFAVKQLLSLASPEYFSEGDEIGHFLLKHGVGHKPGGSEVDTPLDYGDYYFLEALLRFRGIRPSDR